MAGKIPVSNPKANYLVHKEEIDDAIARVLDSGWYVGGEEVERFEREFARYLGVKHVVAVGSGTDALAITLRALEIGPGDEVIMPSWTCTPTAAAVALVGAKPVFVDIVEDTQTMNPAAIEEVVTKNTKAVIPVHLYGTAADMDAIMDVASYYSLHVVEDACQAHGAFSNWLAVGTIGIAGCFSFYPTKNLSALGDGGAIATNNDRLAEELRMMRNYGWDDERSAHRMCGQSRLDPIQAAVLRVKLKYLGDENERRIEIARHYSDVISTIAAYGFAGLRWPRNAPSRDIYVFHQYVVRVPNRDDVRAALKADGIETAIHYPVPVHKQPAYANYDSWFLPITNQQAGTVMSIPMYPELTDSEVEFVAEHLKKAIENAIETHNREQTFYHPVRW